MSNSLGFRVCLSVSVLLSGVVSAQDAATDTILFPGRDGAKKWKLEEIEPRCCIGYAWYGNWPADLINKQYPARKKKPNLA